MTNTTEQTADQKWQAILAAEKADQIDQKSLAQILDTKAFGSSNPPSSKQIWYLAHLLIENGDASDWVTGAESRSTLDKGKASRLISMYLGS